MSLTKREQNDLRTVASIAENHLSHSKAMDVRNEFFKHLRAKARDRKEPSIIVRERGDDLISIALESGGRKKARLVLENHLSKTIDESDFQLTSTGERSGDRKVFIFEKKEEEEKSTSPSTSTSSSLEDKFENLSDEEKKKKLRSLSRMAEGEDN